MKVLMYLNSYEYLIFQVIVIVTFILAVLYKENLGLKSKKIETDDKNKKEVILSIASVFLIITSFSWPLKQKMEANWLTSSNENSIQFEEYIKNVELFIQDKEPIFKDKFRERLLLNLADSILAGYNKSCYKEDVFKSAFSCDINKVQKTLTYVDINYGTNNWILYKAELIKRTKRPNFSKEGAEVIEKYIKMLESVK